MEHRSARISGAGSSRLLLNGVALLSRHFKNSESLRYKSTLYKNACIQVQAFRIANKTHVL